MRGRRDDHLHAWREGEQDTSLRLVLYVCPPVDEPLYIPFHSAWARLGGALLRCAAAGPLVNAKRESTIVSSTNPEAALRGPAVISLIFRVDKYVLPTTGELLPFEAVPRFARLSRPFHLSGELRSENNQWHYSAAPPCDDIFYLGA